MADSEAITKAMKRAVYETVREHKLLDYPIVVWQDGKVVWMPPEEPKTTLPRTAHMLPNHESMLEAVDFSRTIVQGRRSCGSRAPAPSGVALGALQPTVELHGRVPSSGLVEATFIDMGMTPYLPALVKRTHYAARLWYSATKRW